MKIKTLLISSSIAYATLTFNAHADVNSDLNKFFNNINYSGVNYTKGEVWKGQAAGYLAGGGIYARTSNKNIQLASISMPSVNTGCGGIDLYLGSFSYINSEQIARFVKSVMSNAVGYAFDLALTTLAPQLKTVKDFLQGLSQAVNDTNYSSCQAAQQLVGGLGTAITGNKEYVCNSFGNYSNSFSDWAQSTMECGVGNQSNNKVKQAQSNDAFKDMSTVINTNITWYVLNQKTGTTFGTDDRQLKEFTMTLVGTVIFGENSAKTIPPSANNQQLIKGLLYGGDVEIYVCDEDKKCLNPTLTKIKVAANQGLANKVSKMLTDILDKVASDTSPLTEAQINFIDSTNVPVLKYMIDPMSIATASIILGDISKQVTYDLLQQYILSTVKVFNVGVANTNLPESVKNDLMNLANTTSNQINGIRSELDFQESQLIKVEQQMQYIRGQAANNLISNYLANYEF